ncbi:hypothetical protein RhiirC2_715874 [Rhizophagus irregularis]|uniref:Uncharacterized protein n=1 Tax=Rhizophagus irregularis TaxID=588596 RepID=A0A2N1MTP6_9GLOM|nr:hypothetical protein RhiirC2_715874 [Rhizophagus irregularis]
MHTPTIFDQTSDPFVYYNSAGPDEYLSDSDSYNDESDYGSDDYNNHESNCESDSEETSTTVAPSFQLSNVQEQKINVVYTLRKEKFNDDFTPKDLLNTIREISLLPPRDMSDEKGSLNISQSIHSSF